VRSRKINCPKNTSSGLLHESSFSLCFIFVLANNWNTCDKRHSQKPKQCQVYMTHMSSTGRHVSLLGHSPNSLNPFQLPFPRTSATHTCHSAQGGRPPITGLRWSGPRFLGITVTTIGFLLLGSASKPQPSTTLPHPIRSRVEVPEIMTFNPTPSSQGQRPQRLSVGLGPYPSQVGAFNPDGSVLFRSLSSLPENSSRWRKAGGLTPPGAAGAAHLMNGGADSLLIRPSRYSRQDANGSLALRSFATAFS
jgi:hypothetical protein